MLTLVSFPVGASSPEPLPKPLLRVVRTVMPPEGFTLGHTLALNDARRDGSAIGVTTLIGDGSNRTSGVYVLGSVWYAPDPGARSPRWDGGREDTFDHDPIWRPVAILGPQRVLVDHYLFGGSYYLATISATVGREMTVGKASRPMPNVAVRAGWDVPNEEFVFPADALTPRLRRGAPFTSTEVLWWTTPYGHVGSAGMFHEGRMTSEDHYRQTFLPILKRAGRVRPLTESVAGHPDLGQLGWVAPEGWMICSVWKNGREGLAWLEPIRREEVRRQRPPVHHTASETRG